MGQADYGFHNAYQMSTSEVEGLSLMPYPTTRCIHQSIHHGVIQNHLESLCGSLNRFLGTAIQVDIVVVFFCETVIYNMSILTWALTEIRMSYAVNS